MLHSCCAPCSGYPVAVLSENFKVELYFSNSNLDTLEEYNRRLASIELLSARLGLNYSVDTYNPKAWELAVLGLEQEPERGKRCEKCFEYRLERAFEFASSNGIKYLTTTLSVAPYKDSKMIFRVANALASKYKVEFLSLDFKKDNGYIKTKELAKLHGLYIQNYCGCIYSLRDREQRKEKNL